MQDDGWRLRVAARSEVGPVRSYNEDAVAVFTVGERGTQLHGARAQAVLAGALPTATGVALVVLDGMGGQSSGELPCRLILEALAGRFAQGSPAEPSQRGAWLVDAIRRAAAHVKEHVNPHAGQAAAAVVAVMHGATLHIVHAGDVRAYLLREGRLEQRTRDDSLENLYRDHGYTEAQLQDLPRGILTQAIGAFDVEPHEQALAAAAGDVLLLCSDGLHGSVAPRDLEAALRRIDDPAEACAALVAMAVRAGSSDNISALVARLERDA